MSKAFEDALQFLRTFEEQGILLDTNLFVVYVVALVDKSYVGRVKRTENFQFEDANFLLWLLPRYSRRLTTPGILAESSNLLEPFFKSLPSHILVQLQAIIRQEIAVLEEHFVPAKNVAHDDQLLKYGFTDLALAHLEGHNAIVLTSDFPLAGLMQDRGLPCVNYNSLRLGFT